MILPPNFKFQTATPTVPFPIADRSSNSSYSEIVSLDTYTPAGPLAIGLISHHILPVTITAGAYL
ncbi:hypothetical protein K435DRAFT_787281, partial [Dendrothele bispora CBS 962.96]